MCLRVYASNSIEHSRIHIDYAYSTVTDFARFHVLAISAD
jgi:hypothetical protein